MWMLLVEKEDITCWFIWCNRNGVIFRQEFCSHAKVSMMVRAYVHKVRLQGATIDDYDAYFLLRHSQNLIWIFLLLSQIKG